MRLNTRCILFLLCCGLVGGAACRKQQAPALQAPQAEIRIGAWNIEHLGSPNARAGENRGVAQQPADIAAYISAAKVDVLAVEEVGDNDGAPETHTNRTLTEALADLRQQTGQTWQHLLYPKRERRDWQQLCGVAWNTARAQMIGEPYMIPVETALAGADETELWNRHPYGVKFSFGSGKTDLVLITVHMKANTGGQPSPKIRREEEARTLVAHLSELKKHFRDSDIVILGDTNILRNDERAWQIFRDSGFIDLNQAGASTHLGGAPFDRILVPGSQQEFTRNFEVIAGKLSGRQLSPEDFRNKLSDHLMVVTTVHVTTDDD